MINYAIFIFGFVIGTTVWRGIVVLLERSNARLKQTIAQEKKEQNTLRVCQNMEIKTNNIQHFGDIITSGEKRWLVFRN